MTVGLSTFSAIFDLLIEHSVLCLSNVQ